MKKVALSLFLIIAFILYAVFDHRSGGVRNMRPFPSPAPVTFVQQGVYKDGKYTGPVTDAYFGNMQIEAVIVNGNLVGIHFLEYPDDQATSRQINEAAIPVLTQEVIKAQHAHVNIVSGATDSSNAFIESLDSALGEAQA